MENACGRAPTTDLYEEPYMRCLWINTILVQITWVLRPR
jgi:hypothetical protein